MRFRKNILVMGVCGVGKSTVARAIADGIGGQFLEADTFHSDANVRAMSAGIPLTDEMRAVWLDTICDAVRKRGAAGDVPVVLACSALKRRYRETLSGALAPMFTVHLSGDLEVIRSRLLARKGHFMPPTLLDSQLRDLEPLVAEEDGVTIDVACPPAEIVGQVISLSTNGSDA